MTQSQPQVSVPFNPSKRFEDFFRHFEEKPNTYKYMEQIRDVSARGGNTLFVVYEDIASFDPKLADKLRNNPEEMIDKATDVFKDLLKAIQGKLDSEHYFVRLSALDMKSVLTVNIRNLRSKHIDTLVWLKGIIIRSSKVRPKLKKAVFECLLCGTDFEVLQITSKVKWPKFCINSNCKAKAKSDFKLVTKKSDFIDWQTLTVQEIPETLPPGRMPRSVQAILTYDLVDEVKPGDRINLMGVYKSSLATSTRSRNSTLFKTYLQVNCISQEETSGRDTISKEEKKKIKKLSNEKDIQNKIAHSIAPEIYGRKQLKLACALSLFGGTKKEKPSGGYKRGEIHTLFVGDPGTGKSAILQNTVEISPRGLYTSGKGSTAVGITAAVIKDKNTGQMNLEAGAMVLANGGVVAIDEFDKMDSADRSALHEAMEQQTISIAKAGIVATLKAETSVISAANPHSGRYDLYATPTQNIRMPPSLLSRFDLIFVVIDRPNKKDDEKVADFILNYKTKGVSGSSQNYISQNLLRKYIKYARKRIHPTLTDKAKKKIKDFYLDLRSNYESEDAIVSILARNLDALMRMSEAYAKMALRDKVVESDVDDVIELFKRYLRDVGYDEDTGKIDMDRVLAGESRVKLNKVDRVLERLKEIFESNESESLETKGVVQILNVELENIDKRFIEEALDNLKQEGIIYSPKVGHIKLTDRD